MAVKRVVQTPLIRISYEFSFDRGCEAASLVAELRDLIPDGAVLEEVSTSGGTTTLTFVESREVE